VSPFSNEVASVPGAVVATRTAGFQLSPAATESTYAFVAASCAEVGSDRLVILWLLRLTSVVGAVSWSSRPRMTHAVPL
jgi:hypothetical protein